VVVGLAACSEEDEGSGGDVTPIGAAMGGDSGEFTITLDPAATGAGPIVFNVSNDGEVEHEFEVFKTDAAPEDIPVADGHADMEAAGAEEIEEVEDIAPGATAELETDLEAGTYLIVCNLPAHFEQGMYTTFTVE
jgi:uncharacterized cupredoxin-like copper-binding protein